MTGYYEAGSEVYLRPLFLLLQISTPHSDETESESHPSSEGGSEGGFANPCQGCKNLDKVFFVVFSVRRRIRTTEEKCNPVDDWILHEAGSEFGEAITS